MIGVCANSRLDIDVNETNRAPLILELTKQDLAHLIEQMEKIDQTVQNYVV